MTEAPVGPTITTEDLLKMAQIIQVVSSRGAIKADEMSTVGGLHDKLIAFLVAQGAITLDTATKTTSQQIKENENS